jgi:hypothetical protein
MKKINRALILTTLSIFILLNHIACSKQEDNQELKILNLQNTWAPVDKKTNSNDELYFSHFNLKQQINLLDTFMSCGDKSINVRFDLKNASFTTTVIYISDNSRWVRGSYFALQNTTRVNSRAKYLAVQRVLNPNIYDLKLTLEELDSAGKFDAIEGKFANGEKLLIPIDEVAHSLIKTCLKNSGR